MTQTTKTPAIAGYIATDRDELAIYGTGTTPEAAIQDAVTEAHDDRYDASSYVAYPASAALLAEVEAKGGAIAWYDVDGVQCTREERDAARRGK